MSIPLVSGPAKVTLLAPLVFGIHVLEEAPGFVQWFNSVVDRDISPQLFITVNATAFLITLVVAGIFAGTRTIAAALLAVSWLGFLMFANAIFHVTGAIVRREYVPGTVTAAALYLPYFAWLLWRVHRHFGGSVRALLA